MNIYNFKARISAELYYNYDNYFGVYTFTTNDNIPHVEKRKVEHKYSALFGLDETEEGYLAGDMQKLEIGMSYNVKAELKTHKKYGFQYVPLQVSIEKPTSTEDSIMFLQAFCTKNQAKKIIEKYPDFVQSVLNGEKVFDVPLKPSRLKELIDFIETNYHSSDIMSMLTPLGITYKTVMKLTDEIPNTELLMQTLEENPYILTKIHGLGFKKIDDVALKINPDLIHSDKRMQALIRYVLTETANSEGHTLIPLSKLRIEANDKAPECIKHFDKFIDDKEFITKVGSLVGLKHYYWTESFIYNKILELSNKCDIQAPPGYDITKTEEKLGLQFTKQQVEAIKSTTRSDFIIISGSAGTGKTTVIKGILDMYDGLSIGMCALAAKAANRMTEITKAPAYTIHRILKWKGNEFQHNRFSPLPYELVILDEASMVNSFLFSKIVDAIGPKTKFIIVFDHAQLPPIGAGNIAADLLSDPSVTRNKFTKIHRQAEKSGILLDANFIRQGKNPIHNSTDQTRGELADMHYKFLKGSKDEIKLSIQKNVINSFFRAIEVYGIENVIVILPRKKNAVNSTTEINHIIHERLFDEYVPSIRTGKRRFALGARIIQRVNDYDRDVINGEIGTVSQVNNDGKHMIIDFGNNKEIEYEPSMFKNIDLAYALTVHSYQGSQSDIVIIGIDFSHYILLDNCLLYTAITRASKQCKIISDYKAFSFAVGKNKNRERKTFLKKIVNNELQIYEKDDQKKSETDKTVL